MIVKRAYWIREMLLLVDEEYTLGLEMDFLKRKRGSAQTLSSH